EDGEAVVAADLAGGEGVAARQRADAAEAEDDMRAVDADGGEGLLHGLENIVDLGLVAGRLGIVGGNVGCASDDPALDGVEDADAAVAVDEVDHVVAGGADQFGVVEDDVGALGAADEVAGATDVAVGAVDPRAGGVDNDPGAQGAGVAGDFVAQGDCTSGGALQADVVQGAGLGAGGLGVLDQLEAEALRVGDARVEVGCGADDLRVEGGAQREGLAAGAELVARQRRFAAGKKVVEGEAGLDEERSA